MAVITTRLSQIAYLGGVFYLEIDWDDTDAVEDPIEGGLWPDTGDLLLFRIANDTGRTGTITIDRRNKADWKAFDVPPATFQEFPPSGPVRQIEHIAAYSLGLVR